MKNNNAKFTFFYLLSLVALLFMSLATGQVFFQAFNKYILDFTTPYSNSFNSDLLKVAISALFIAIPLYYLTMCYLERSLVKGHLEKESAIRRWLIYFILFVSSVVAIIWLIATISSFLNGELTSKFILKAIVAVVISAIIFSYYLYDIKRENIKKNDKVILIYLIGTLIIVIGGLVFSFFFVESPKEARARRHDSVVLDHFTQIDSALNAYFTKTDVLPDKLDKVLEQTPYLNLSLLKDPISGKAYDYKKTAKDAYELCATFQTDNRDPNSPSADTTYIDRWPHNLGYQCLKQNAVNYDNGSLNTPKSAPVNVQ